MANYFKNWSKNPRKAKRRELSNSFPVHVGKYGNSGMQIEFQNDSGEAATFILDEPTKKLFLMNIDRFIHGKQVTRQEYGLD